MVYRKPAASIPVPFPIRTAYQDVRRPVLKASLEASIRHPYAFVNGGVVVGGTPTGFIASLGAVSSFFWAAPFTIA